MRLSSGVLLLSPSDLVEATTCRHRMVTAFRVAHGVQDAPSGGAGGSEAVAGAGDAHEAAVVQGLRDAGLRLVDLSGATRDLAAWRLLSGATLAHLRRPGPDGGAGRGDEDGGGGVDAVLQGAVLLDLPGGGVLVGRPDVLRRTASGWRVEDAKLARSVRPTALLQTMLYRHALAEAGVDVHHDVRLHLGSGAVEDVASRTADAWARRQLADVVADLAAAAAGGALAPDHVERVDWCTACGKGTPCAQQRAADRHLSGVADLRRDQARRLRAAGISTLDALAAHPPGAPAPAGMDPSAFEQLREQAELQLEAERTGTVPVRLRPHPASVRRGDPRPGLWSVPDPDAGDVFFDMEGYPLHVEPGDREFGLEYLFGAVDAADAFTGFWADDRAAEGEAFTAFVDWVQERRQAHPGLHVFHYAPYERSALLRLAARHQRRGDVLDEWLRDGVLVDLYATVRGGLRAGVTSYSIKDVEALYGVSHHTGGVEDAGQSIEEYSRYAQSTDPERRAALRDGIERYNELDCTSTRKLRDHLLGLRAHAVASGAMAPLVVDDTGVDPEADAATASRTAELREELAAAAEGLLGGLPVAVPVAGDPGAEARRVLAGLLGYQVREEKAAWQDVFRVAEDAGVRGPAAAVDDAAVLGGLRFVGGERSAKGDRVEWTFTAPVQDHRVEKGGVQLAVGGVPVGASVASVEADPAGLRVVVAMPAARAAERGWGEGAAPAVDALVPAAFVSAQAQQRSLLELAGLAGGAGGGGGLRSTTAPRRAGRALLLGRAGLDLEELPPRAPGEDGVAHAVRLARSADGLVLAVQGPPGAGKSHLGSVVVDALLADARAAGRSARIGVTANSHAVVQHLLGTVHERSPDAVVRHRQSGHSAAKDPSRWTRLCEHPGAEAPCPQPVLVTANKDGWAAGEVLGGTAWAFSPEGSPELDWLVVDEAGQMSLGDVLAASRNARNVLLLGDPQQLAKPARAAHPPGVGVSALEHLMGTEPTMPPELGIFQEQTWRMHSDVAGFISDIAYGGRLAAHPSTADRRVLPLGAPAGPADEHDAALSGTGLRFVPVVHEGDAQGSAAECDVVVALVRELLRRRWTMGGAVADLTTADVLVVSPYNVQVRRLRSALERAGLGAVKVGTVDRFQGQQAAAVVYSTASSDAEAAPRGLGFLYDVHRLNVAVSRARCLAFWVGSPQLLRPRVTARHEVPLVDAHCRFVERAVVLDAAALTAAPG